MPRTNVVATAAVVMFLAFSLAVFAQRPSFHTMGSPELENGQPDLNGPAPRMADGKPDLSGAWGGPGRGGPGGPGGGKGKGKDKGEPDEDKGKGKGTGGGHPPPASNVATGYPRDQFQNMGVGMPGGLLPYQDWALKQRAPGTKQQSPTTELLRSK